MILSVRSVVKACQIMVDQVIEEASQPVCLAVVDNNGALVYLYRMDGTPERLINIAIGKAYTAAKMGVSTAIFKQRLLREQLSLVDFLDEKFTSLPGGLPLFNRQVLVGAVGVSGQAVEDDISLCLQFAERIQIPL